MVAVVKNLLVNTGDTRDTSLIPGSRRSSGVENGNPLQLSSLENPTDKEPGRLLCVGHKESDMTAYMHTHSRLNEVIRVGPSSDKACSSEKETPVCALFPSTPHFVQRRGHVRT